VIRRFSAGPVAVMAAGLAGLILAGVVACRSAPPRDVGSATVSALASAPASPSAAPVSAGPPVSDGSLPTADPVSPPVSLRIPALKLTATVDPVGVTGDVFDVPPSVDRVGWYEFGASLSDDAGSLVIAGHVDSAAQGRGAFFRLGSLSPGDKVTLRPESGPAVTFKVVGREVYAKTRIPLAKYFARDGALRLTLITCGGPFDKATGHYRDNIVVTATPITSSG
jgi:hypothetical protein